MLTLFALAVLLASGVFGAGGEDSSDSVKFNFPESVELTFLVDFVSEQTQTRFLYDESLSGSIVVRSPLEVRMESLVPVLRSILTFKGYTLTESEGWYKITRSGRGEAAGEPADILLTDELPPELRPDGVYVLMLKLEYIDPDEFRGLVKNATGVEATRAGRTDTLVLADYGRRIRQAVRMAEKLDRPHPPLELLFYVFRHVEVSRVRDLAMGVLRSKVLHDLASGGPEVDGPAMYVDQPANRMILLVPPEEVDAVRSTLQTLDPESEAELRSYRTGSAGPEEAVTLINELVKVKAPGLPHFSVTRAGVDRLVVLSPPAGHRIVDEALESLQRGEHLELRYYPVQYVQASRIEPVARRILELAGERSGEMLMLAPGENTIIARLTPENHRRLEEVLERFDSEREALRATRLEFYQIRNTDAQQLAGRLRAVLGVAGGGAPVEVESAVERMLRSSQYLGIKRADRVDRDRAEPRRSEPAAAPEAAGGEEEAEEGIQVEAVRIVADEDTNSIIVQAPVEYHETIQKLIEYLDRRRPQVMIEATIAAVSSNSDLSVAVELLQREDEGTVEALVFSAFGLSEIDVTTGERTIEPGTGFNASVIDPDGTSAIIRALHTDDRSRVVAEPRLLVNDNAQGRFESIREEPFTSTNIGDSISTTSFAGYAEAGITIEVSPRISEGSFVRLEYSITSRDFTETAPEAGIPPARTSDTITSSVTVPDGHTVVMGGLSRERGSMLEDRVPLLGSIPVLGALFRSTERGEGHTRLFVFLRPVILDDEDFSDLKGLSRPGLQGIGKEVPGPDAIYPPVEPRIMR